MPVLKFTVRFQGYVPAEVASMGEEAVKMYVGAVETGNRHVYRTKLLLITAPGVDRAAFKQQLLAKRFVILHTFVRSDDDLELG